MTEQNPVTPDGGQGPEHPLVSPPARQPHTIETDLADGEWHRLHPATPLLKGGIGVLVVLGVVITNLRERLVEMFIPAAGEYEGGDPIDQILENGLLGWALLVLGVVLIVAVVGFYVSWRMHSFRVTDELVEVRSGILFRTNRRARLDRIQGINVIRPVIARIFGAAKLEVSVAGQDANVQLSYLGFGLADALRRDILRLASGAVAPPAAAGVTDHGAANEGAAVIGAGAAPAGVAARAGGLVGRRFDEIAREYEEVAPPESVVKIHPGRLVGSLLLSGFTLFLIAGIVAVIVGVANGAYWVLFALLPGLIGSISYYSRRFVRSLRYSIASTPDGVRVGFGVLSTSSDTIPPGRIHAIEVRQPLLWRAFGWWEIKLTRAGVSAAKQGANADVASTILPIGDLADVTRVLGLLQPQFLTPENAAIVGRGLLSKGADDFTSPPSRAVWLRPFSWRRTGYLVTDDVLLLRRGAIWRTLSLVPLARVQSAALNQGPLQRALGLANGRVHTVAGPVITWVGVMSTASAYAFFDTVSRGAVAAAERDTSHRWGGSAVSAPDSASNSASNSATFSAPESTRG